MSTSVTMRMTEGRPERVIVSFALPIFISQLFQQLYNTADAWIVGHFLGTEDLAAVTSSGSLVFLLVSFFFGTSMGAGVVISRYFGAGRLDKVSRAVHTNVALSLILGLALTAFGVLFTPTILGWMKTDPDVMDSAVSYLRYYFAGALAMIMYNSLKGVMSAVGDSRRPLYYLIISALTNIFLDWLFIGVLKKGVAWAAIATTISQLLSAILCLVQFLKKGTVYTLALKKLRIHGDMLREILRYGLPSGVQNSVIAMANVLVQTNINTFGKYAMAACGSYSKVEGFVFLPIMSFSMALTTYISQNLGGREYERAKKGAAFGILVSLIMAELIGLATFLLADKLIGFFNNDSENAARVIEIGAQQCRIEAFFYCLLSFSHCVAGICRGAGKATVPMVVMLTVWCVLRIVYITVAMRISHDIRLLFTAYPLTWTISSAIFLIYYLKSDWVHGFERKA
ncbi:MAG: MATE family efflux transporter [Oscillospiraceae bacterium]|nr:MATE family efflux transporter [Oscillospiraceae bacterium]